MSVVLAACWRVSQVLILQWDSFRIASKNWCSQKSEKLLIQNGLSHDTFEKKELPDEYGSEGGVAVGESFGG